MAAFQTHFKCASVLELDTGRTAQSHRTGCRPFWVSPALPTGWWKAVSKESPAPLPERASRTIANF